MGIFTYVSSIHQCTVLCKCLQGPEGQKGRQGPIGDPVSQLIKRERKCTLLASNRVDQGYQGDQEIQELKETQ